jgi:transcriptional regulator with XRE-family HTH domain
MGLSQEKFGAAVGWHRTFVGAVERGERNLTLRSVERISDQLGVHPLDLLWDRAGVAITIGREGVTSFMPTGAPNLAIRAASDGDDDPAPAGDPAPAAQGRRTRPRRP